MHPILPVLLDLCTAGFHGGGVWAAPDYADSHEWRLGYHPLGGYFPITFGQNVYDTSGGGIANAGKPNVLSGGDVSTGLYNTVDNETGEPISHKVSKTLTTVDSSSTSLTESIELTNQTTLEAGTDTAKVSDTLEEKFGISKTSTSDHSESSETVIEDEITVDIDEKVATVYTEDRGVVDQAVDINALCDWGSIRIGLDSFFHDSGPKSHYLFDPRNTLIKGSRTQHYFEVNGWDALISVLMGYDIRAPGLRAWYTRPCLRRGQDGY